LGSTNEYHKKKKESENEIKTEVNKETQNLEFKKEDWLELNQFHHSELRSYQMRIFGKI